MLLLNALVEHFRSIDRSGVVDIDPRVTVLVGQNESGKTAFLNALNMCRSVQKGAAFDVDRDYPRKGVNEYRRRHEANPANVVTLTFGLSENEVAAVNGHLGMDLIAGLQFSTAHHYKNDFNTEFTLDERSYARHLAETAKLPAEMRARCQDAPSLRAVIELLTGADLNAEGEAFLAALRERFTPEETSWESLLEYEVWRLFLKERMPKFFFFDDYYLLPGKVNLASLAARAATPKQQNEEDKTVLSLLRLADVDVADLTSAQGYEQIKSRLEGLSNSITDRIFQYWTQNQELDVEFDIRADPKDRPPFNEGPNLYIRIKNRRHRATVPFSQRSKGFIWFFSFIVWFDTIKQQIGKGDDLILLLDEPGLSLHALAQADFLKYIDTLSAEHQILYTTHSPFMVHSDRLHQVRLVEDRRTAGTVITSNVSGSDPKTLFPLQAALGYTVAQNLFITKRNLLVEGPADLVYLRFFSAAAEKAGRSGLRDDVTIVPTGGLDKVATFIALLGANRLELAVLHDWAKKPDQRIESLVEERLIKDKLVLHYALFRGDGKELEGNSPPATDVEDLFTPAFYLEQFNGAFKGKLPGEVREADLPPGDRIVGRLERYLANRSIKLRPKGGFNHYAVASYFAANPPATLDYPTLARFERLFAQVNALFTPPTGDEAD